MWKWKEAWKKFKQINDGEGEWSYIYKRHKLSRLRWAFEKLTNRKKKEI